MSKEGGGVKKFSFLGFKKILVRNLERRLSTTPQKMAHGSERWPGRKKKLFSSGNSDPLDCFVEQLMERMGWGRQRQRLSGGGG